MISSFFPTRDCCTLVRPLTDEEALQRLATTPEDHLRPEFREQVTYNLLLVAWEIGQMTFMEDRLRANVMFDFYF